MGQLIFDRRATYLVFIEKSIGTTLFQHCFFDEGNCHPKDVCESGELSCAFYVSCILKLFDLIRMPVVTVASLEREILNCGWKEIGYLRDGAVVFWEEQLKSDGKMHRHAGFYRGGKCISNNSETGVPVAHHPTFDGSRLIDVIYFPPALF